MISMMYVSTATVVVVVDSGTVVLLQQILMYTMI